MKQTDSKKLISSTYAQIFLDAGAAPTISDIAARVGMSPSRVAQLLRALGIAARRKPGSGKHIGKLSPVQVKEIRAVLASRSCKETITSLGARYGVTKQRISQLKNMVIP